MTEKLESISLLLIEDNPADAELIRQFLLEDQANRYEVTNVVRFSEALEEILQNPPDIALLDLNLPDSDSRNTLSHLQDHDFGIPIIVLTGNKNQELGIKALQYGAQDFLVKDPEHYGNLPRTIQFALERFATLQALQASEERYRLLSEVSSDYMFAARVEPDGSVVQEWTTGAIEDTTGYTLKEYLERGGWRSIVHPDDYWIDDQDMATLRDRENVSSELRIIKKDQSIAWVHVKGLPLWDEENNRLVGIVGSTLDITQRKQNELQLKNSEQRFKTMFDQAPLGIGLTNAHTGEYQQVNDYFTEMVGYSEQELLTMKWMEITHPDDIDLDLSHMNRLNAGEIDNFQIEKRYQKKDGTTIWVNMKVTPVTIPGVKGDFVMSMVEDINAAKTAQKRLIESENRFRSLYEQAPIGITLTDSTTGKFIQVNPFFANMLGYSIAELQSKKWMEITHAKDIDEDTGQMERLLAGKIFSYQMEKRFIHANGQIVWVDMKIAPLGLGESGNPIHISMVEDITEQKYSQEQLVESENRFRLLYEQAPIPYQSLDEDGMMLDINDAWLEELGYHRKEVVGEYFAKFLTDQDAELFPQNFARFKQLGEIHGIEYQMLHKDQHTIDVSFDGRIVRDTKGRFLQTHCVFTNVTERKRLQNALESRILALTRPMVHTGDIGLTDLFDLDQIQQLQDDFSNATRVASIITDPDGIPITKPSNFCRLCNDIIRCTEKGRMNCFKSDAQLGRYNPKGPIVLPCLSGGLWDAGASISVGGQHIANWLIGQVRDETQSVDKMVEYANEIGADEDDVIKAFYEVPTMSQEQFNEISRMLFTLSGQLSKMAYQNIQQARFITEQKQAEYEKERSIGRLESLAAILQYPYEGLDDFLDFALNEATQLTDSKFGYIFFYDDEKEELSLDTYSKAVWDECKIEFPKKTYQLQDTGIWGEAVRQRKTIILNDFQSPHPQKKGVPEGHVQLTKFMTIPVIVEGKIEAVVGMANKETDYDHQDELQLTLLMDNVWKVVERHRAMDELSDVSHRLQHYTDSSPVIIFAYEIQNDEVVMTWSSDNPEKILGYSKEEINSPEWWIDQTQDQNIFWLEDVVKQVSPKHESVEQDYYITKKSGERIWINEKITVLFDATLKPVEAISVWTDITVRKQIEESAAESAARLETALSNMADAVFLTDAQGNITHFNHATVTFFRFKTKEECASHFTNWGSTIEVMSMDGALILREDWSINRALRGEKESNIEYMFRRKDTGESWYGRYNFAPIHDEEGTIIGSVVTASDITEQKQAELAQERNISRLESMTQVLQSPYENIEELMDLALEEAIELTDSQLGYILFYDDEIEEFTMFSWSEAAMAECAIPNPPEIFKLKDTGIWGEVVRQRKALILNDYNAPHPQKKGYPEGHVRLEKFLTIPVFSGDRIVAAVGVANKKEDYTHEDELQLRLLMDNIWKVVERRKAVEELTDVSHRMQHYVDSSDVIIYAFNLYQDSLEMTWCSENVERILGYPADEVKINGWWWKNKLGEDILSLEEIEQWDLRKSNDYEQDYQFRHKDGNPLWINEKTRLLRNKDGQATEAIVAWTDITNRKLMEESVKEGAATLEAALTSMSDAVLITDALGNFTHISDSFIPYHRLDEESTIGLTVEDWFPLIELLNLDGTIIPPEDWLVPKALRGESGTNHEFILRNKQNNEVWYGRYNYGPFYNDAGEIIGAVVTGSDITEQKELLQNIQQYAEDLNRAQSVAHLGSWKWNIETDQLSWSDELFKIAGIDKEKFNGSLNDIFINFLHPEDRLKYQKFKQALIEYKMPPPEEFHFNHPDGNVRTIMAEVGEYTLNPEGKPYEITGIIQDITERKLTETQLLLQNTALNAAANSILITDREGNIQWVNPAYVELTGYSFEESIGQNPRALVKSEEHDQNFYQNMWNTIQNGNTWRGDLTNRKKDGSTYEEHMTITPIQNQQGKITNFIAIKEDITLRKQNEAQINRHLKIQEKLVLMGRAFSSMIDIQLIYRTAYRYINEIMDVVNMAITLYDDDQAGLRRVFAINEGIVMDTSQFSMLPYLPDSDQSYRSRTIATQKPIITNDLVEKEKQSGSIFVNTTAMTPQSAIYVPLVAEYKVLGVLELQSYQQNAFTEESSEWLSVVANQIALAYQNVNLYSQIRDRVSQLGGLREIDSAINAHQPLEYIYQTVFSQIQYHIRPDAADILLLSESTNELVHQSGFGFNKVNPAEVSIPVGSGLAGTCVKLKKQIIRNGPEEFEEYLAGCEKWKKEGFETYIGLPIIIHHECVGVLEVFHRSRLKLQPEDMQYLQTLAGQIAIAMESNTLISDLQDTANELVKAYDATIEGWSMAMDLRDRDTEGHTQRVTELTMKLAEAAGYPQEEMEHLRRGALLHDIGKLGVPDYILLKPGKLDPDEWDLMKQHPTMAYDMLKQVEYLLPALDIPRYHHERWDGSGYPEGLAGEEIPLSARIFAFVDVWDAVTNDRPYKEAWSEEKALQLIRDGAGTHFDPWLAELFIDLMQDE